MITLRRGSICLGAAWVVCLLAFVFLQGNDAGRIPAVPPPYRGCTQVAAQGPPVQIPPIPEGAYRVKSVADLKETIQKRAIQTSGSAVGSDGSVDLNELWPGRPVVLPTNVLRELLLRPHALGRIGIKLIAKRAWVDGEVNVLNETIPDVVKLKGFIFTGPLEADGATFADGVQIRKSIFGKSKEGTSIGMSNAIVHGMLDLRFNKFAGEVDLSRTQVDGNLYLHGEEDDPAVFAGNLDASDMIIKGSVVAIYGCFLHEVAKPHDRTSVSWRKTAIDGSAAFGVSEFRSPIDFSLLTVHRMLDFQKALVTVTPYDKVPVSLKQCENCFSNYFNDLHVDGSATFGGTVMQGCSSWEHASFEGLDLGVEVERAACPKWKWLNVDGLSYVRVIGGASAIHRMAKFFDNLPQGDPKTVDATYAGDAAEAAFAQLEVVTRSQGYHGASDQVYVQGRRWQQQRLWHEGGWWSTMSATWRGFVDFYVRYGRAPGRALIFDFFLIVGFAIFLRVMQPRDPPRDWPNPFEYSVTCFLPDKWHVKRRTPESELPRWLRLVVAAYMFAAGVLFIVLIFFVSGEPWPAVIPILGGALIPFSQRVKALWRK